jgi:hypothetical protein
MIAPEPEYHSACHKEAIWVLFDVRQRRAVESPHLLRGALQEFGDLEFIDQDHAVLIARPGGARRLEA